jgi:hypothetical protein
VADCPQEIASQLRYARIRWVEQTTIEPLLDREVRDRRLPRSSTSRLRSWDRSAALTVGEEVQVETQVLGPNGELLDAPAATKHSRLGASPGTTRVDRGKVVVLPGSTQGELDFS